MTTDAKKKQAKRAEAESNGHDDGEAELKAALLEADDDDEETEEVEISGIEGTILVRGLSREESYLVAKKKTAREAEAQMITIGLVRPKLTYDEVLRMFKRRAGISQAISDAINRLSGMEGDSRKEAMATFLEQ